MAPEKKPCKVTFNGKTLDAVEGELAIDVARRNGIDVPHYCYHPALGNPGNCRLCVVEVAGAPKPMVSCRLPVKEGMDIKSDSEAARRAQQSSVELHLVNHPLDCPVCDQSGECGLQDYYMKYGRHESQVREDKLHKSKRVTLGEHVMLDQERCVLCTRCTRFTSEVTKTHELGVFGRGHKERIELTPGMTLDNAYSGNVVDICPVGALTDRDFRFKVRVWYLDKTDSICPGCANGCSTSVHTNTKRPWHNEGRRVGRLKPRYNPDVNGFWLCDEGRYSYKGLDEARLGRVMRLGEGRAELTWDEALSEVSGALRSAKGLAVATSGLLSNEDAAALKKLLDSLGNPKTYFDCEPDLVGAEDALLRKRDKVPNMKGLEAVKLKSHTWGDLARDVEAGKVDLLYVIERDLFRVYDNAQALLSKVKVIYQGPQKNPTAEAARWRLPATAYVEEEGHYTNHAGRVQKYEQALAPLGQARPDWRIFEALRAASPAEARA